VIEKVKVILGPKPEVIIGGRGVPYLTDAQVDGDDLRLTLKPGVMLRVEGAAVSAKVKTKGKVTSADIS
jgi:hypothetical protein